MQIGDIVKVKVLPWKGWAATVIDDCYRQLATGVCTALVKFNNKPTLEVELTLEEIEHNGKDV